MFGNKINLESVPISFGDRKFPSVDTEPFIPESIFTIGNDLVLYDQNQNCKVELFELKHYYGDVFTTNDLSELRRIVRLNDSASYLRFKNQMDQKRDSKIIGLIRQQIELNENIIKNQVGIGSDHFFTDSSVSVENKALALQDSFVQVYNDYFFASHFLNTIPDVQSIISTLLPTVSDLNSLIVAVNQRIQEEIDWVRKIGTDTDDSYENTEYAEIKYNETLQSDLLDQLEKKVQA